MKPYGHERETFPYWKVQFYRPEQIAWFDIQQKFTNQAEAEDVARLHRSKGKRARLMQIERSGRTPLPEPESPETRTPRAIAG
jgi:hypothetical protein